LHLAHVLSQWLQELQENGSPIRVAGQGWGATASDAMLDRAAWQRSSKGSGTGLAVGRNVDIGLLSAGD
jgi:hypothetical protein